MFKLSIADIQKTKMNYEAQDISDIKGRGSARLEANVTLYEKEPESKYNLAEVKFKFGVFSDTGENESDNRSHDGTEKVKLELVYKVVFRESEEIVDKEVNEAAMLYYLEPYLRKEVDDILRDLGLPTGIIPYGIWENDKIH